MSDDTTERLEMEIKLLEAMYPSQVTHSQSSYELKFMDNGATLLLRLPETYPSSGLPDIISAVNRTKTDIRNYTRLALTQLNLSPGEESLDAIIAAFQQLIEDESTSSTALSDHPPPSGRPIPTKTVIIWLHHLLNTNKRKLALSPSSPLISGITKPGYPGVLVYSGPADALTEHVNVLKAQNWQAFQVRYEEEEEWRFAHEGVREVESMSEVVKGLEGDGEDEARNRKEVFLKAVGIK